MREGEGGGEGRESEEQMDGGREREGEGGGGSQRIERKERNEGGREKKIEIE